MTEDEQILETLTKLGTLTPEAISIYLEMNVSEVKSILSIFEDDLWYQPQKGRWHILDDAERKKIEWEQEHKKKDRAYSLAIRKAEGLINWIAQSPVEIEFWTERGISKWVIQYKSVQDVCREMEADCAVGHISEDILTYLHGLLTQIEEIYNRIPSDKLNLVLSILKNNQPLFFTHESIHIKDADTIKLPINVYRRLIETKDITLDNLATIKHVSARETDCYTYDDLFAERISRILPLNREEEDEYFNAYNKGNESARDAIIESTLSSIWALSNNIHCLLQVEYEELDNDPLLSKLPSVYDIFQQACLIAIESFENYFYTPYTRFETHAKLSISKHIADYLFDDLSIISWKKPEKFDVYIPEEDDEEWDTADEEKDRDSNKENSSEFISKEEENMEPTIKEPQIIEDTQKSQRKTKYPHDEAKERWKQTFKHTTTSYKYFWALALIKSFGYAYRSSTSINLVLEYMIAIAWPYVLENKMNFGKIDKLFEILTSLHKKVPIPIIAKEQDILQALKYARNHKYYNDAMKQLAANVPYRFLSSWISIDEISQLTFTGLKITDKIDFPKDCMYVFNKRPPLDIQLIINPQWNNYMMKHRSEMKDYILKQLFLYSHKCEQMK